MDMPITKGMALRKKMGLHGRVNADELAERLALTIEAYPFKDIEELKVGDTIILAERLDSRQRRWAIAHGIGHYALHEGNQMWCRAQTLLAPR